MYGAHSICSDSTCIIDLEMITGVKYACIMGPHTAFYWEKNIGVEYSKYLGLIWRAHHSQFNDFEIQIAFSNHITLLTSILRKGRVIFMPCHIKCRSRLRNPALLWHKCAACFSAHAYTCQVNQFTNHGGIRKQIDCTSRRKIFQSDQLLCNHRSSLM